MKIKKEDFQTVARKHQLPEETAEQMWQDLESKHATGLNIPSLAYYLGALIVISAMGWFLTKAWDKASGLDIMLLGLGYFLIFGIAGHLMYRNEKLKVPGGLLLTVAVSVVPLIVYGVEEMTGIWPSGNPWDEYTDYHIHVRNSWIYMEIVTVLVGTIFLWRYKFPFLTFPVTLALWYLSMDLTPLLFGQSEFDWDDRSWVSTVFGLVMLVVTYLVDRRTKRDFAFWGYLFGLMAFWGGLSSMDGDSEMNRLIYCGINLFLMLVAVLFQRTVFLVFGAMGVFGYLGYLANRVFEDSLLFPIALSLLGLLIIFLGVLYQRNRDKINAWMDRSLPVFLKRITPQNRMHH